MVGRYKIIRGVPAAGGSSLPKISVDETDRALGSVADSAGNSLLRYNINAAFLAPEGDYTLFGNDRGSGRQISAVRSAVNKIASDAAFNNKPVINLTAGSGDTINQSSDIRLEGGPTSSFTIVAVTSISAGLKASPAAARIASVMTAAFTRCSLTMLSSGAIIFGTSTVSGESAVLGVSSVPAADVPFVIAGTYDHTANLLRIYLNNNTIRGSGTPTAAIDVAGTVIGIGGPAGYATSVGWLGKIAEENVFDTALDADQIAFVMTTLKTKYGIA